MSELVEEHTVIAKRLLTRLIYLVIGLQALLSLIDGFPLKLSLLSIASHIIYLGNMRRFPVVKLTDALFITSCGTAPLLHNSANLASQSQLTTLPQFSCSSTITSGSRTSPLSP